MAAATAAPGSLVRLLLLLAFMAAACTRSSEGKIPMATLKQIGRVNRGGARVGVVVPLPIEMNPLLQSRSFVPDERFPFLDFAAQRRSHYPATSGLVRGGRSGALRNCRECQPRPPDRRCRRPSVLGSHWTLGLAEVRRWAKRRAAAGICRRLHQRLQRQHAFWVPAGAAYFALSKKLEGMALERCVNSSTCLPRTPAAMRVARGCSANTFVDNAAYRGFLSSKFNVTAIDMESAAVALVCLQRRRPFIAFRALSDLAGGGSAQSNEASVFAGLAAGNAVAVAVKFISLLD